jgi:exodeoxyribonuclease VII large subunit
MRVLENRWLVLKRAEGRLGDPRRRIPDLMLRVDSMRERAANSLKVAFDRHGQQLAKLVSNLDHLSPLGVLAKGYSVVEGMDGRAIRDASSLNPGDELRMRFHKGSAEAKVIKTG